MKVVIVSIQAKEFETIIVCSAPEPNLLVERVGQREAISRLHLGQAKLTQAEEAG